jgi:hypothetical protein
MSYRVVARAVAAAAFGGALALALVQVRVGEGGVRCGTVVDVVTDRVDWEAWYRQDALDDTGASALTRTRRCPGAVDARTVASLAALTIGLVAAAVAHRPRRPRRPAAEPTDVVDAVARLGRGLASGAAVVAVVGVVALAGFLADADALVFDYVGRPVVLALGLAVLTPVAAVAAFGRALTRLVATGEAGGDAAP